MFVYAMTVGPVATNCYLLGDERTRTGAIIDPGANGKEIAEIAKQSGYQFDKVLLTHSHFDHITGLGELLRNLNPDLPIYVHKSDYPGAEAGFGSEAALDQYEKQIHFYDAGDVVPLGEAKITVFHTPGHTPGGVCLQVEDCLFTGDTLFCNSCGRTDLPSSNPMDMMASLRQLGQLKEDYIVYPGHDQFTTLDQERQVNPFMRYVMQQN